MKEAHIPVLLKEVIAFLAPMPDKNFVDATCGFGGHTEAILEKTGPKGIVVGIDQDKEALEFAKTKLLRFGPRFIAVNDNYSQIKKVINDVEVDGGVLADLGVSSYQLDQPARGFSFMKEGPLDMRMDQASSLTAEMVVNGYPVEKITKILTSFADERFAKRIAENIEVARRKKPIKTTTELAEIVWDSVPKKFRQRGLNPATRTFQAIRMEVNNELGHLKEFLPQAIDILDVSARLAVITFHSREDKIVANCFKHEANPCTCPPQFPKCVCGKKPRIKIITKKAIQASINEKETNPRSRSARLRVIEKIVSL